MNSKQSVSTNKVKSVANALELLNLLAEAEEPSSLSSINEEVDLHKSSIHRLLQTMVEYGFVEQDLVTKEYEIGLRFFEIASSVNLGVNLRQKALPALKELRKEVNETIHLGITHNHEVVYIDKMEPDRALRMYSAVGKRAPIHATGLGKAVLAHFSDEEIEQYVEQKGLKNYTDSTITNLSDLKKELEEIRNNGYAIDNKEHEEEIVCVAAPIFENKEGVIAALSVAAPASRKSVKDMEHLAPLVVDHANSISSSLGWIED